MYVLGHDHVAEDCDPVPPAHIFQRIFEKRASRGITEKRPPLIAAECKKMQIAALLIAVKTGRHDAQAYVRSPWNAVASGTVPSQVSKTGRPGAPIRGR